MTFRGFLFLMFITLFIAFFACNNSSVYESYSPVGNGGWQKDSVFTFYFNIDDSTQNHNLYFNLRNSVDYGYSNIWLFLEIHSPEQNILADTVEFILADRSGRWLGQGLGKFRDNKLLYKRNIFFPSAGEYSIDIQHGMRHDLLTGVTDIGISIKKVN